MRTRVIQVRNQDGSVRENLARKFRLVNGSFYVSYFGDIYKVEQDTEAQLYYIVYGQSVAPARQKRQGAAETLSQPAETPRRQQRAAERRPDTKKSGPKPGDPRVVEAGRKGGQATAREYGAEFYKKIGEKGGAATKARQDSEYYREIGRKGRKQRSAQDGDELTKRIPRQQAPAERAAYDEAEALRIADRMLAALRQSTYGVFAFERAFQEVEQAFGAGAMDQMRQVLAAAIAGMRSQ